MNYSTAVMLINENIKAVNVIYEPDTEHDIVNRTMFKTVDHSLKKGDLVIVPTSTRLNFTIAQIDEFDVEVDFEDTAKVEWIVGRAPTEGYNDTLRKENEMISVVKASEKRAKREEIRSNMLGLQEEQKIETLAIANLTAEGVADSGEDFIEEEE